MYCKLIKLIFFSIILIPIGQSQSVFTWEGSPNGNKAVWAVDDVSKTYIVDGVSISVTIDDPLGVNTDTGNPSDYNDYTKSNTFFGYNLALQATSLAKKQGLTLKFNFSHPIVLSNFIVSDIDMLQSSLVNMNTYQDSLHFSATNSIGNVPLDVVPADANPIFTINGQGVKANYQANTNNNVLFTSLNGMVYVSSTQAITQLSLYYGNGSQDDGLSNSHAISVGSFDFNEILGSISGSVINFENGSKLANSTIRLVDLAGNLITNRLGVPMEITTGVNGDFSFSALPIAPYRIVQVTDPSGLISHSDTNGANDNIIPVTLTVSNVNSIGNIFYEASSAPLAVALDDLSAKWVTENIVKVSWSTLNEVNNDFFTIYASNDGFSYQKVGTRLAEHSKSKTLAYSFDFKNPYQSETLYIKLEQQDLDGTSTELGLVTLRSSKKSVDMSILDNPVRDFLKFKVNNDSGEGIDAWIYDVSGKVISAANDTNPSVGIDVSHLSKGTYILKIKIADAVQAKQFIKL